MNIETAINTAIEYESRIRDLYLNAAKSVTNPAGIRLFQALAKDEQHHVDYLQDRLHHWQTDGTLDVLSLKSILPDAGAIQDGIESIEDQLGEKDFGVEQQMLSKALHAEKETSDFYKRMVDDLPEAAKPLFSQFLSIENDHINIVQAQLDYIMNTGYWFDIKEFDME